MVTFLSIIGLGFLLGMRHATDPDHVIAVTTIVSRQKTVRGATLIGTLWGIGHTLTIVLVGAVIILFSVVVPARLGLVMELSVAVMLILLGIMNLGGLVAGIAGSRAPLGAVVIHTHLHSHGDYVHSHPHLHGPGEGGHAEADALTASLDRRLDRLGLYHMLRPLVVGVVHGLAGSAAVALLVLTTIQKPMWAVAYLLVFGSGTVAGMMLITTAIAMPFTYTAARSVQVNRYLGIASGLLSFAFGVFMLYQIGFVEGLFASMR